MRKPTVHSLKLTLFAVATVAVPCKTFSHGQSIVSPSNFEYVESSDTIIPSGSGRVQILYHAADFSALQSPHWITQFAWRPDGSIDLPVIAAANQISFRLSTSEKTVNSLSNVFDENVGPDVLTVYNCAPCMNQGESVGIAGGPKEFTIKYELEQPFYYDPDDGNLLLDFDLIGAQALAADHILNPALSTTTRWIAGPINGSTATVTFGGIVTEFQFSPIPEPSAVTMLMLSFICCASFRRR